MKTNYLPLLAICLGLPSSQAAYTIHQVSPLLPGANATIYVVASQPGRLNAWLDANQDGVLAENETILDCTTVAAGTNRFQFTVPVGAKAGYSRARFQMGTQCPVVSGDPASANSVQDLSLRIRPRFPLGRLETEQHGGTGLTLTWEDPEAKLVSATGVVGPYSRVAGAKSPYAIPMDNPQRFYRLLPSAADVNYPVLLARADAVFEGTVTQVQYRDSDTNSQFGLSLPCTFVTFRVEDVIAGNVTGSNVTLRFLGGPAADGRFMQLSDSTWFDVGERSIIFARKNGLCATPLVHGRKGRYRLISGEHIGEALWRPADEQAGDVVVTEDGRPLVVTDDASIAFGRNLNLNEVRDHDLHGHVLQRIRHPSQSEQTLNHAAGTALSASQFKGYLRELTTRLATAGLVKNQPLSSADIQQPFYIPEPTPVPIRGTGTRTQANQ